MKIKGIKKGRKKKFFFFFVNFTDFFTKRYDKKLKEKLKGVGKMMEGNQRERKERKSYVKQRRYTYSKLRDGSTYLQPFIYGMIDSVHVQL